MNKTTDLVGRTLRRALIFQVLACFAAGAGATVRLVDDDKVQCPSAAYTTLADAVAAAGDGDSIVMCAGSYAGGMALFKSLSFSANAGTPASQVTVGNNFGYVFWVNASNVSFTGFTIASKGSGVDINSGSNFTFANMKISAAGGAGINGYGGSGSWGFNGTTVTAAGTGVYVAGGSSATFKNTSIDSSTSGFSDALQIGSLGGNLTLETTKLTASGGSGLSLTGSAQSVTGIGLTITTSASAFNRGIYIANSVHSVDISSSKLTVSGTGIQVNSASDMHIDGVNVSGGAGDGIYANYLTGNAEFRDSLISVTGVNVQGINLIATNSGSHKLSNLTIDAAGGANGIAMQNGNSMSISGVCVKQSATAVNMGSGSFNSIIIQNSLLNHGSGWAQNGLSAGGYGSKTITGNCFFGSPSSQHATNWGNAGTWSGNYWEGVTGSYSNSFGLVSDTSPQSTCPVVSCYGSPVVGGTIDHIRILHDGQGLTCTPEAVTVQACVDAGCSSLYSGSVSVTLAPTGWVGGDTVTFSGGSATVSLSHTTAGTVALGTTAVSPAPAAATDCYVGASATCGLTFAEAGFLFSVPQLTACRTSDAVAVKAVKKDTGTGSCAPAFTGTRSLKFYSTYQNPATGSQALSVNGTAVAGAAPGTAIPLTFDGTGAASITLNYSDAGSLLLNASYAGGAATGDSGLSMTGSSQFLSVPAGLVVYPVDAAAVCGSGGAACAAYRKAGEGFDLAVKAACWDGASSDLSLNPATPNFQLSGVAMTHTLAAPAGGAAGVLGIASFDFGAADAGIHRVTGQTVSEAGVFAFQAAPSAYQGASLSTVASANLGRFYPDHFSLSGATLTNRKDLACSAASFTYLGEPLRVAFTLTAQNRSGGTTTNYDGTFTRLDSSTSAVWLAASPGIGLTASDSALGDFGASRLSVAPSGGWSHGIANFSADVVLDRGSAPDGPYDDLSIRVQPKDSDGVTMSSALVGTSSLRYGRMRLQNAYGIGSLQLPVPLTAEYYAGAAGFVTHAEDDCSGIAVGDFTLENPTGTLSAASTSAILTAGACPGSSVLCDGSVNLKLASPGAGAAGSLDLRLHAPAWLRYDWDGDGDYGDDPLARVVFGIFKEDFIDLREAF